MSEALRGGRRVLIITGGSGDIGAAAALKAAALGYDVCISYMSRKKRAGELVERMQAAGARAMAVQADTSSEEDVRRLFETCRSGLGPVTHLVNNAGIVGRMGRVADSTAELLRKVLAVNVVGYFLCAREAVRAMSTVRGGSGGAIVNISSRAAALGGPNEWVHYAASKGAVDSFTVGLAREVAAEGIRVNAVSPGLIDTRLHASAGDPGRLSRLGATVPMGRPGSADEVADAILYLLSGQASYITGVCLDVSGGR